MIEDMDPEAVQAVVGGHRRFADPFAEPNGYSILTEAGAASEAAREDYFRRLRYAAAHADALIAGAFRREFYDFYGVDRDRVSSPEEMCRGLRFDSFVLDSEKGLAGACLSSGRFLFGHYIECWWDRDWRPVSLGIC